MIRERQDKVFGVQMIEHLSPVLTPVPDMACAEKIVALCDYPIVVVRLVDPHGYKFEIDSIEHCGP